MKTKKNDFVEIKFTGYSNGKVFDSNIESDLKEMNEKAKEEDTIIIIGEGMVVPGLDKALEDKEIGEEYEVTLSPEEGFGKRKRELVKTIPLSVFTEKKVNPQPGMVLALDNTLVRIITISGARVITDFNNPLSGKEIRYKFKIVRKVEDVKEKCRVALSLLLKFVPDFDVNEKVTIIGQKGLESYVKIISDKFKELIGKDLEFKIKEEKIEAKTQEVEKKHGASLRNDSTHSE